MNKKMGLMALGLSMALLSGCGSSNNDDLYLLPEVVPTATPTPAPTTPPALNLNTPAEVTKNIVGSWDTGCDSDEDESDSEYMTFNADGTGHSVGREYDAPGCNADDEVDSWDDAFRYTIGEATTGFDGEDAVEINYTWSGGAWYTMVHFNTVDVFLPADDVNERDGLTPETRGNSFRYKGPLTRQSDSGTETPVFTYDLLVGKTYAVNYGSEEEETYAFSETEVTYTEDGETDVSPYTIDENGVIIFNGGEGTATLLSVDASGDLHVFEDWGEDETVWVLIS